MKRKLNYLLLLMIVLGALSCNDQQQKEESAEQTAPAFNGVIELDNRKSFPFIDIIKTSQKNQNVTFLVIIYIDYTPKPSSLSQFEIKNRNRSSVREPSRKRKRNYNK